MEKKSPFWKTKVWDMLNVCFSYYKEKKIYKIKI